MNSSALQQYLTSQVQEQRTHSNVPCIVNGAQSEVEMKHLNLHARSRIVLRVTQKMGRKSLREDMSKPPVSHSEIIKEDRVTHKSWMDYLKT